MEVQLRNLGNERGQMDASAIQHAIEYNQDWPTLGGRRDVAALDYSLSPAFQGDRVAAFTYAIGSMLVTPARCGAMIASGGQVTKYRAGPDEQNLVHRD